MEFQKYMHVEKLGHLEVEGILDGMVHVFPKLDGTNASVWTPEEDLFCAGSRKRELSSDADNAGFHSWLHGLADRNVSDPEPVISCLQEHPWLRLYGEWLVPHTFKGYRPEAWRHFWVFDAWDCRADEGWVHWDELAQLAERYQFDVVTPLAIINHPSEEQLLGLLDTNTFLCQDGAGPGEGLVIKRYDYVNRFGRATWAKLVRAEFKDRHKLVQGVGPTEGPSTVERQAAEKFCTEAFVAKERAKVENSLADAHFLGERPEHWAMTERGKEYLASRECRKVLIPRLLSTVFYELVREHAWDMVKEWKRPTLDFKKLERQVQARVKAFNPDLF